MQDLIFYNKYDNEIIYLNLKIIRCHTTECRVTNVYLFKKFEFENIKIRFRLDVSGNYSSLYLL